MENLSSLTGSEIGYDFMVSQQTKDEIKIIQMKML